MPAAMTPKKGTNPRSTSTWQIMANAFSRKKRTSSNPFKTVYPNDNDRSHDESEYRLSLDECSEPQSRDDQMERQDLVHTVTQLRSQLVHLKEALEEQERMDARKDELIIRLTHSLQRLQSQSVSPPRPPHAFTLLRNDQQTNFRPANTISFDSEVSVNFKCSLTGGHFHSSEFYLTDRPHSISCWCCLHGIRSRGPCLILSFFATSHSLTLKCPLRK